jgi:hypothetical protein
MRTTHMLPLILVAALALSAAAEDAVERAMKDPPATGLLVTRIMPGSQAQDLGLAPGDVIVRYGNAPTPTIEALRAAVGNATGMPCVTMEVVRGEGTRTTYTLAPGLIGVHFVATVKGVPVEPLPPATDVKFDFSRLAEARQDDWYAFHIGGKHVGFEHGLVFLQGNLLYMRREVAFDAGEQWGVNHFDVSVAVTRDTTPRLVSWRFANPIAGYLGVGKIEEGGSLRFTTHTREGATGVETREVPQDLPAFPSYLIGTLACFMPREKGACFHYRPITDGDGTLGQPSALVVVGEDTIEVDGEDVAAWRLEIRAEGGAASNKFWVDANGHVIKGDYSGAVAVAASKEEALKGLHEAIEPRSAK